jgi:hypothetical protein
VFDDGRLSPERLIDLADRECYSAKASGGNRIKAAAAADKPRSQSRTPREASCGR